MTNPFEDDFGEMPRSGEWVRGVGEVVGEAFATILVWGVLLWPLWALLWMVFRVLCVCFVLCVNAGEKGEGE